MSPLPEVISGSEEPLYNIGVVSRMTGVSMATLRAWERRYDFPESERTAGGHRLYSENDVMRLRWVKDRIDEGMQTAQAINALRHQETSGHLITVPQTYAVTGELSPNYENYLDIYRERLFDALAARDLQVADVILGEAMAASSPDDLILDLIGPTLAEIGDGWETGKLSIVTEHLATNYLRQRLLMWMLSGPPPRAVNPIILACAPDEWHEGSLLILGALLRRRRWPIVYLGQSVPLSELSNFARDLHPSMIVLVAMTETAATGLVDWPRWLPEVAQTGKPVLGYGGRVFTRQPEWRSRMPGIYLGDDFRQAVKNIENLI